jgi:hypothetical protein
MQTIGETIIATTSGPIIAALIIFVLGGILSWMGYRDVWKLQATLKQPGKR